MLPFKILRMVLIFLLLLALVSSIYNLIMLQLTGEVNLAIEIADSVFMAVIYYYILTHNDWPDDHMRFRH